MTFPPGSSAGDQACISTPIYSDGILERSEESFVVAVFRLESQSRFVSVPLDRQTAFISIIDTNGK